MSIKTSFYLFIFFTSQIQMVMGNELNVLTVKEFQNKISSTKIASENLKKYEINNGELITLYEMKSEKKILVAQK